MEELARDSISLLAKPVCLDSGKSGLSSYGAIFILLKSALGAGLLNFPWAFNRAGGIHTAIAVEMVSLIFLISGLVILGYSCSISNQSTYQGVVKTICGSAIGNLCEICFVFNVFMISIAFLVVVGDQLSKLCDSLNNNETMSEELGQSRSWYLDHRLGLSALCVLVILPISVPKEIGFQKCTSVLGTFAASYLTIVVVIKFYLMEDSTLIGHYFSSSVSSWTALFSVVPTICFGFQCHEASVAIYSSMQNRKLSHWIWVSIVSMIFCLFIYSITGFYGYLTFGTDVEADILMSYPENDILIIIGRLLFGISIITIYPIILLLGRSVIQELWVKHRRRYIVITVAYEKWLRVLLTVIWISVTLAVAVFVPDISEVISLIGGISAFFIFIFPGLCLVFAMQTEPVSPRARSCLIFWGTLTILCGVFIFGQSTAIAIMEVLEKF
eukprot:gi/632975054/ref/XP_007904015.1/ PREDICTED: putative sodium-coupled neutral amino acid transporter 8 [Callorhinchus milii]